MEKENISKYSKGVPFVYKNWKAHTMGHMFVIANNGSKLLVYRGETLEKVIFDLDKKTISVKVKNPNTNPKLKIPRTLDLSDEPEFFDLLRENMEILLTEREDTYEMVGVNKDRTEFEVKSVSRWANQ